MKRLKLSFLLLIITLSAKAQTTKKYWISFDEEIIKLEQVVPQLDSVNILSKSNWLNAITTFLTEEEKASWENLSIVSSVEPVVALQYEYQEASNKTSKYGDYITTLDPEYLELLGVDGTGVVAGVIDAGFINVDSGSAFKHFIEEDRILGYKDFIDGDREDFFAKQTSGDIHGANVLAYFGGKYHDTQEKIGLATGASFYLARTENGDKEHLVEEDDWIEAIEWMHGKGVRLVNTSLGYSTFDDSTENHTIHDMNGKTTKISIAAQKAADKGMILVCSAGNLGHKEWKYVSAPADAEGVISVGATTKEDLSRAFYSSIGPEFNSYLKPDIATYSDRGTSYSSPEIAGLVACMLQNYPNLTPKEVKKALYVAGHLSKVPNNYLGYGVPDTKILFDYLAGNYSEEENEINYLTVKGENAKIHLDKRPKKNLVLYLKSDKVHVQNQAVIKVKDIWPAPKAAMFARKSTLPKRNKKIGIKSTEFSLVKFPEIKYSTLIVDGEITEIIWE